MNYILPALIGIASVMQSVLNRRIGDSLGLTTAVAINATVLLVLAWATALYYNPSGFKNLSDWQWYYLIPGLLGFLVILGLPQSIGKIGVPQTFLVFVTSQIIFSCGYEYFILHQDINIKKWLGAIVSLIGVLIYSI